MSKRTLNGTVVSAKNDKTIIVSVVSMKRHPLYKKMMRVVKKYAVHDPENIANEGDNVRICEHRPVSKTKRFCILSVND